MTVEGREPAKRGLGREATETPPPDLAPPPAMSSAELDVVGGPARLAPDEAPPPPPPDDGEAPAPRRGSGRSGRRAASGRYPEPPPPTEPEGPSDDETDEVAGALASVALDDEEAEAAAAAAAAAAAEAEAAAAEDGDGQAAAGAEAEAEAEADAGDDADAGAAAVLAPPPPVPAPPVPEEEVLFGELARLERFATAEQVAEALRVAERLRSEGRPRKIGKIMVKLGYLTATQAKYLLRLQRTPDPIEGYKLLERRGQGGMGVVYRAVQKSLKREVALKILAPKFASHSRFLERFVREAKLAGQLKHPNVVAGIDVGTSNGLHYYVMEYVDGWSVAEILKEDGPFEEAEALDVVLQIAKALEHASAAHIVHRDVKPENILVTPDGVAKLADLGLSKQLTVDCSITTEGKTLGTPFYVSPELARGERQIDVRSDIYSLGATLYHMLAGAPPFTGDNPTAIMARHLADEPPQLRKARPTVSAATARLVLKMMGKDPRKRHSPQELIRDVILIKKGKNPFAGGRSAASAAADSSSARVPLARDRADRSTPPGPFGVYRGTGAGGGAAARTGGRLKAVVAVAVLVAGLGGIAWAVARNAGVGGNGERRAGAEADADPQRAVRAAERVADVRRRVEQTVDEGKGFREALGAADELLALATGTPTEAEARALRARVASEGRAVAEADMARAQSHLRRGEAANALDILMNRPPVDLPDVVQRWGELKAEAERATRGGGR